MCRKRKWVWLSMKMWMINCVTLRQDSSKKSWKNIQYGMNTNVWEESETGGVVRAWGMRDQRERERFWALWGSTSRGIIGFPWRKRHRASSRASESQSDTTEEKLSFTHTNAHVFRKSECMFWKQRAFLMYRVHYHTACTTMSLHKFL